MARRDSQDRHLEAQRRRSSGIARRQLRRRRPADRFRAWRRRQGRLAYAIEDYDYWAERETFAIGAGLFGENLTVRGMDLSGALVGERWRVGTALLEVAQPRLPCYKLGIRVDDSRFIKRFQKALRPGAYLRIIEEGAIQAGDRIQVIERPAHGVTMRLMVESLDDAAKARAIQAAPRLPENWREG